MHQHQIDTMVDPHEHRTRYCHDGHGGKQVGRCLAASLCLALLCVLTLGGCNAGGSGGVAVAQQIGDTQNKRIETFMIDIVSFVLNTDSLPNVEVRDSATVYVMQSDGDVTFQPSDGSAVRKIDLELNDVVIERPGIGVLTVMRDQ